MTDVDDDHDTTDWLVSRDTGIARKFTLWVLLSAATLFVVLIFLIVTFSQRSFERELVNTNTSAAGLVRQVAEENLTAFSSSMELFAQRPALLEALRNRNGDAVTAHLQALVESHADNSRSFIADTEGVLRYDYPEDPNVLNVDFSYRDWYLGVSGTDNTYLSPIYQRAALDAPYVVAIAAPVRDGNGTTVGYLVLQRTVQRLAEWISRYTPQPGGSIRLFDRGGTVARIQAQEPSNQWTEHPLVLDALAGNTDTQRGVNPETGERSLMSYAPIERFGWAVLVSRPWDKTFAPAIDLRRNIIAFAVVALLILCALGYYWLRSLLQYQRTLILRNKAIQRYAAQLKAANQELESFSYSVSHDLRAPLRAMDGFSRILQDECGESLTQRAQHQLGRIRENAVQMGQLIDDLLAFSRLSRQGMTLRRVDPNKIVDRVLSGLDPEALKKAEIVRSDLPHCEADSALLTQVFNNLIDNALKYSQIREHPTIEIGAETRDGTVCYIVKDNGAGFDMAYAEKLFGVFQRLHRAEDFPGTGVGLAVVQRIVHRHGGEIWAESEPDHGAAFYFTLKLEPGRPSDEQESPSHSTGGRQPE